MYAKFYCYFLLLVFDLIGREAVPLLQVAHLKLTTHGKCVTNYCQHSDSYKKVLRKLQHDIPDATKLCKEGHEDLKKKNIEHFKTTIKRAKNSCAETFQATEAKVSCPYMILCYRYTFYVNYGI